MAGPCSTGSTRIRLALLDGALPVETLIRLRAELAAAREATDDPRLDGLLQEIEVRAEVELAKLEVLATPNPG